MSVGADPRARKTCDDIPELGGRATVAAVVRMAVVCGEDHQVALQVQRLQPRVRLGVHGRDGVSVFVRGSPVLVPGGIDHDGVNDGDFRAQRGGGREHVFGFGEDRGVAERPGEQL